MTDFSEPKDGPDKRPDGDKTTGRPTGTPSGAWSGAPAEASGPPAGRATGGRPTGPWTGLAGTPAAAEGLSPTTVAPTTVSVGVVPPPPVSVIGSPPPAAEPVRIGLAARLGRAVRTVIKYAALLVFAYVAVVALLIVAYRWINPPATTLILAQRAGGASIRQAWVPLDRISPNLVRAVIMSEDARFCSHGGVDWKEIEQAFEQAQDGIARGGSTISMQVAKNLFLWPSKSYVRKALEIPETLAMETMWTKRRMLEIYLNIAEWGPGVFGAEAAAQYHFRKPAIRLTEAEAALLAVALPNPIQREAGRPGSQMYRLAQVIQGRVRGSAPYVKCILG